MAQLFASSLLDEVARRRW